MKTVLYGVREIETRKIWMREKDEQQAVNFVGQLNKKANKEKFEVVKVVITEEVFEI